MILLALPSSVILAASVMVPFSMLLVAGCASPGPPRAPSLHLPEVVSSLVAERVGNEVLLRWTTPAKTTDGLNLGAPLTAQLCRRLVSDAGKPESSCNPVRRLTASPGPANAVDILPPAWTLGLPTVVEYRMEILNGNERSAGLSAPAFAAAGAVPPMVAGLRAEATPTGALLQWIPADAADQIEIERLHSEPATASKIAKQSSEPLNISEKQPTKVHLLATKADAGRTPFVPDAGGTLDRTAEPGETYTYTAQRVRRIVVNGRAFELRSAVSSPVMLVLRDNFSPNAPIGVEAIAAPSAIDLSWKPNIEVDLAGYLVYRTEVAQSLPIAPAAIITPGLVLEPAFRDIAVRPGHTYLYTVVAVDKKGNRSVPSEPAREEVPVP